MIARLIRSMATATTYCQRHGEVVEVHRQPVNVVDKGYYMAVDGYATTFADGHQETFWMRGYKPVKVF